MANRLQWWTGGDFWEGEPGAYPTQPTRKVKNVYMTRVVVATPASGKLVFEPGEVKQLPAVTVGFLTALTVTRRGCCPGGQASTSTYFEEV